MSHLPDKAQAAIARTLAQAAAPARNNLGEYLSPVTPTTEISYAVLANRYASTLSASADVGKIRDGHLGLHQQQQLKDDYSPTNYHKRISAASDLHGQNPCQETESALRHLKSLDERDFCLVQHHATQVMRTIMADISDECRKIMRKAGELALEESATMDKHDRAFADAFEVTFIQSPLSAALARRAREFSNVAKAEADLDGIPELIHALLADK